MSNSMSRRQRLTHQARQLVEDISGFDLQEAEGDLSFVELGLDSLTLTEVAWQIKRVFQIDITFRALMESVRSLDGLVDYLDKELPPDAAPVNAPTATTSAPAPLPEQAAAMPVAPPAVGASRTIQSDPALPMVAVDGSLAALIQQQLQLMSRQLSLLAGQSMEVTAATASAASALPIAQQLSASLTIPAASAAIVAASTNKSNEPNAAQTYGKKAFGDDELAIIKKVIKECLLEIQEVELPPQRVDAQELVLDASRPPVPGARLGRDNFSKPAWFVPNPSEPGKFMKIS